jgi:hypothetical protein
MVIIMIKVKGIVSTACIYSSLGMNHDLRPFCGDSKKMMSLHPEGSDAYEWSKCSRMFLKQFLE